MQAAQESVVLLTNKPRAIITHTGGKASMHLTTTNPQDSRAMLPLDAGGLTGAGAVAVVGPNALMAAFGNYAGSTWNYTTVLGGIRGYVPGAVYARGCDIASNNTGNFSSAVALARAARVTIAVMGIDQSQEHETGTREVRYPSLALTRAADKTFRHCNVVSG